MIDWRQNDLFKFWAYTILANLWAVSLHPNKLLVTLVVLIYIGLAIRSYWKITGWYGGF